MTENEKTLIPYKFRDLKVYGSLEWLADGKKKYRRVFDRSETNHIYAELSFYNKLFDESDWEIQVSLKAYILEADGTRRELSNYSIAKQVSKDLHIVSVHHFCGNRQPRYFKAGSYEWEAYIDNKLVATQQFWVEDIGVVTEDNNPYFRIEALKLYEGPNRNIPTEERIYYKHFDARASRYIFVEFTLQNAITQTHWNCELFFKFYNDAHQLKGETTELVRVRPEDRYFTVTSGWGSNDRGTWFNDKYTLEVIFMDQLVAVLPFEVGDSFEQGMSEAILPGPGSAILPKSDTTGISLNSIMSELDGLIGLYAVKKRIKEYAEYLKFLQIRTERGFDESGKINLHTVFTGNPGTGKTTVAKMLGQIYKQLGLLSKGHVHDVDRSDLVGEYIGQTAPKVKEAIKEARGGILFIDEAYSLARTGDDLKDFGREVIEILIKEMSEGPGDLAVIVAGYPREMRTFIDSNPGLKSRFIQWFDFPDYSPTELADIAQYGCEKRQIELTAQAKAYLFDQIVEAYRNRNRYFGNARYVNTILDQAKINLGLRIMKNDNPRALPKEELAQLIIPDIEPVFSTQKRLLHDIPIDEKQLSEAFVELEQLTGIGSVKKEITELVNLVRFYREVGKEVVNKFSLHTAFLGNPGTGKTTVARILAKIFKALGILERGHLVECDRQTLVAGYVGQTAIKTAEKIDEALGGVLFIDEAYALSSRQGNDFGNEAIETLIKRMEDQKGEFIVVVAGYTDNMKLFLEANPGLKSRFDRMLNFDDFSPTELYEIAENGLRKEQYSLTEAAQQHLQQYCAYLFETKDRYFGNGRTIIKMAHEVIKHQNLRLATLPEKPISAEQLHTIELVDVQSFDINKALSGGRKRLGFGRSLNNK
jgi:SpoVK/Ycf46/Vps4 family AAA+-type ATPase